MNINMLPLVSVIIPCYNVERYAEKAIRSIMNQTYMNIEIICINDGSTDGTLSILKKLKAEDNRITIIDNDVNLKLIKSLNLAISSAKGEYIARMDADDISMPTRIEKQLQFLIDNKIDLCCTYTKIITDKGKFFTCSPSFVTQPMSILWVSMFDSPMVHPGIMGKSLLFKKFSYQDIPEAYVIEDYYLWCIMLQNKVKMGVCPQFLLHYRRNPNGESVSKQKIQYSNHIKQGITQQKFVLGYSFPTKLQCRTILDYIAEIPYHSITQVCKELDKAYEIFKQRYSLSRTEKDEIRNWIMQRKIQIANTAITKGRAATKMKGIVLLIKLGYTLCYKRTWINIYYRFQWIFGLLKEKYETCI